MTVVVRKVVFKFVFVEGRCSGRHDRFSVEGGDEKSVTDLFFELLELQELKMTVRSSSGDHRVDRRMTVRGLTHTNTNVSKLYILNRVLLPSSIIDEEKIPRRARGGISKKISIN